MTMEPMMPKNAYELCQIRDEMKQYLERLEKAESDDNGCFLMDFSFMAMIRGNIRRGIDLAESLLYLMTFNAGAEGK